MKQEQEIQPRVLQTQPENQKNNVEKKKSSTKKIDPNTSTSTSATGKNPMADPSSIREENQSAFYAAEGQRKNLNIQKFKEYMTKRRESLQQRIRICNLMRQMFIEKQKNTKVFLKNILRYFEDYVDLYMSLQKSIGKLQLKKKCQNIQMYEALKESISELVKLNQQQTEHLGKFIDWLQKILVEAFKSAYNYFREKMKKLSKDVELVQDLFQQSKLKQDKVYEKLSDASDLLEKQFLLIECIKNTDSAAINRAVKLNEIWENLLEEENTIKKLLKDNILQFYDRFVKFHKKTDSATAIFKYWSNLPLSPPAVAVYASFLDEKSTNYINFGSKSKKLSDNFQNFIQMSNQQQRIGSPQKFLDILTIKRFESKLQLSQREWKDIRLTFTIDKNLLIIDTKQEKVFLKLMQSSIKLKRISENILQLNGVQQGVIFNSKKKQAIHFETLDEVEEFIYFVNSIPNKKEDQK